jgi:hypothetical protein
MVEVRELKESRRIVRPKVSWGAFVFLGDYVMVMVMHVPQHPDLDQQLQKWGCRYEVSKNAHLTKLERIQRDHHDRMSY